MDMGPLELWWTYFLCPLELHPLHIFFGDSKAVKHLPQCPRRRCCKSRWLQMSHGTGNHSWKGKNKLIDYRSNSSESRCLNLISPGRAEQDVRPLWLLWRTASPSEHYHTHQNHHANWWNWRRFFQCWEVNSTCWLVVFSSKSQNSSSSGHFFDSHVCCSKCNCCWIQSVWILLIFADHPLMSSTGTACGSNEFGVCLLGTGDVGKSHPTFIESSSPRVYPVVIQPGSLKKNLSIT